MPLVVMDFKLNPGGVEFSKFRGTAVEGKHFGDERACVSIGKPEVMRAAAGAELGC